MFFGDGHDYTQKKPLNVISIRLIENSINLQHQIQAITALDNCISNNMNWGNKISADAKYGLIIRELFGGYCSLNPFNRNDKNYHQYLYQTFDALVQFKHNVKIDIDSLCFYVKDELLLGLLMNKIIKVKNKSDISAWIDADCGIHYGIWLGILSFFFNIIVFRDRKYIN